MRYSTFDFMNCTYDFGQRAPTYYVQLAQPLPLARWHLVIRLSFQIT